MFNIVTGIHSLADFQRNDPDVIEAVDNARSPVVLTVHGKAKYVVQDVGSYQQLLEAVEELKVLRAIIEMNPTNQSQKPTPKGRNKQKRQR